jgi:hypothetical protein
MPPSTRPLGTPSTPGWRVRTPSSSSSHPDSGRPRESCLLVIGGEWGINVGKVSLLVRAPACTACCETYSACYGARLSTYDADLIIALPAFPSPQWDPGRVRQEQPGHAVPAPAKHTVML